MQKLSLVLGVAVILVAGLEATSFADGGFKSIDFATAGAIKARADLYEPKSPSSTLILLFHQAGWSRGEYRELAPGLTKLGYRVMAVDQRSGGAVNGIGI